MTIARKNVSKTPPKSKHISKTSIKTKMPTHSKSKDFERVFATLKANLDKPENYAVFERLKDK